MKKITKSDLLLSIGRAAEKNLTYGQWVVSACVEFGIFAKELEKLFSELIQFCVTDKMGDDCFAIISMLRCLPGEFQMRPKSDIIAAHLTGKNLGMDGRIVKEKKFRVSKKGFKSYEIFGIAAGRKDKPKRR